MVALLALPRPALAAPPITVGDGTAASCTQAALRDALTAAGSRGGGTVRFRCGRNRVTITLTATLTPSDNTTIDGGGLITLDGALAVRVVFVGRDTSVVLNNLGISNGTSAGSPELSGGGAYNAGALTVMNSTFSGNGGVPLGNGGAIHNEGTLAVANSTFSGNGRGVEVGGAISNGGTLTVESSTFSGNDTDIGGGGIFNQGALTVDNSEFSGNHAFAAGAIYNEATLTVSNSAISGNTAGILDGGAIFNVGSLTVYKSTIAENTAGASGGGIFNGGRLTVKSSAITNNIAREDGGGIYTCCGGTLTLRNTSVTGNTPDNIAP